MFVFFVPVVSVVLKSWILIGVQGTKIAPRLAFK
jgi:hypothetical protein